MKQFILFILVLLPVCAFAQFTETFDGPEIGSNNPWIDDSSRYVINEERQLAFDGSGLTVSYTNSFWSDNGVGDGYYISF